MKFINSIFLSLLAISTYAQSSLKVIGYFSGNPQQVENIQAEKLTHIIFSFCHMKGNQLHVDSKDDSITINKLVDLKKRNPQLKVMLSLGGWGGCAPCSDVFSSVQGREEFATSTLALNKYFHTDGIDLDWEYPTIEGFPNHAFKKEDKENFSGLIKVLREKLGSNYEISFAAGGFKKYMDESVDWSTIMPLVDRVNLMSYDLVNGYSTITGHHTSLYSDKQQPESTDYAVQYLINHGVPKNKIVIGGAFYARMWENVPDANHGLYQSGKFKAGVDYKNYSKEFSKKNGFQYFWDEKAQAPYFYSKEKKLFATGDDKKSIRLKTKYVKDQNLQGIMFWELTLDDSTDGLLSEVDKVK
ncbi:MAG: glycoside hydrolase family 18 protein [Bacteroidetes bacterium]|nr:glycoside hydrolase family 18 protein [Bacteroidota bacterium]